MPSHFLPPPPPATMARLALLTLLALPLAILLTRAEAKAPLHNLRAFHGFMEVHNRTYHSR